MWLALHLFYIIGFKKRITTLVFWTVSFVGRGRPERAVTEQQVPGQDRAAANRRRGGDTGGNGGDRRAAAHRVLTPHRRRS